MRRWKGLKKNDFSAVQGKSMDDIDMFKLSIQNSYLKPLD
jgi:hypothetical protein